MVTCNSDPCQQFRTLTLINASDRLARVIGKLRFDGRVAIVTGAGRGLGRAYAMLLAARGASVIVNDLGTSSEGDGHDEEVARSVVAEIASVGGRAVADDSDVATPEGAETLIARAVGEFKRLDIVVNNAGIVVWSDFPETTLDDLNRHLAVHVAGSFNVSRAAWPRMVSQHYGRIVNTTSNIILGLPKLLAYGTAKAGVVGLTRGLAAIGREHGILVNCVSPQGNTRGMTASLARSEAVRIPDLALLPPEVVSPLIAYLAHEACGTTGETYLAAGGRVSRIFIGFTIGHVATDQLTPEDVRDNWKAVNDQSSYYTPVDASSERAKLRELLARAQSGKVARPQ